MEYISIIYSVQPNKCGIPMTALEDLKLTGILPDNVLRLMQVIPSKSDAIIRQEMFRYFFDHGTAELEELSTHLVKLKSVFEAYDKAEDLKSKYYIFAALLYRICSFYRASAELDAKAGFFEGYVKYFTRLYDEAIFKEAEDIYTRLIRSFSIAIKENALTVTPNSGDGYASAIYRCAAAMDISLSPIPFSPKYIGGDFAQSIASLYPQLWSELEALYNKYKDYPDKGILDYIDQLDFYIENIALAKEYSSHSVPVGYAHFTDEPVLYITEGYDITLMSKQCYDIVPNDVSFDVREPVFFLAGANGGGKTTYLRTAGVSVIMSLCGCPVPCRHAKVCALDGLFTHFPRDERFELDGRFLDEQKRVDEILCNMGHRSLILLNETYATTNEKKATEETCQLALRLKQAGQFCIYVTHQKGIYDLDIPMLCCVVDGTDANRRTYKIRRVKENVISHAEDILKKYSLSRADLEERFGI